jgi:hypothetical protein
MEIGIKIKEDKPYKSKHKRQKMEGPDTTDPNLSS